MSGQQFKSSNNKNESNNRLGNVLDLRGVNDNMPDNYIQPSSNRNNNGSNQTNNANNGLVSLDSILGLRNSSNLSDNPNLYQGHINFHHSVHHDGHHILDHVDPDQHQQEQQRLRLFNSAGGGGASNGLPSIPNLPQNMSMILNNNNNNDSYSSFEGDWELREDH